MGRATKPYRNLRRGGPPRKKGQLNAATREIKALAEAMTVGDQVWLESARRRMLAGEANHLELFFLSHRYGKPKNLEEVAERPPIIFVSQHGRPGDYDPLARPAKPAGGADAIAHQRSMPMGTPPDLPPRGNGH